MASNPTVGQLLVLTTADDSGVTNGVTGVTDTAGNTWVQANTIGAATSLQTWYTRITLTGASFKVNVAWNTGIMAAVSLAVQEFSGFLGIPTLDINGTPQGATNTAPTSQSISPAQAAEIIIGSFAHGGATSAYTLGAGYSNLGTVNLANAAVAQESKIIAAIAAQQAVASIAASRDWVANILSFYDAASFTPTGASSQAIYPDRIYALGRRSHLQPGPYAPVFPILEPITLDKWLGYKPEQLNRLEPRAHQFYYGDPTGFSAIPVAEPITSDKWTGEQPDRHNTLSRRHTIPSFFAGPFPEPELVQADKWHGIYPDYIYRLKDRRHSYPHLFTWYPDTLDILGWRGYQPDYIIRSKDRRHGYPSFWNWLPDQPDDDSWVMSMPAVIFRLKDPRYRMPSFFEFQQIPQTVVIPNTSWRGYQPDYLNRHKSRRHMAPQLFRFEAVIFTYVDPQTTWTPVAIANNVFTPVDVAGTTWEDVDPAGADNWTPKDMGATNSWTPNTLEADTWRPTDKST